MNTKKAIEWLDPKTYIKELNEVVALLKRGEKYETMWEKTLNEVSYLDRGSDTLDFMFNLEKIYFPKEAENNGR